MGYRDPEEFLQPAQPQPQQPSEAVQVEQMRQQGQQQLAQLKGQTDIQVARMTQEFQAAQAQQETELEAQRDAIISPATGMPTGFPTRGLNLSKLITTPLNNSWGIMRTGIRI